MQAFSNSTAAAAVGRKSNNQVLPVIGAIGMLLTNTVLTIGSGVGAELIMNQNALAEKHAKTKAEEYITGLKNESQEKNSPYFSQYQEFSKKCDQGEEQLQNLEKDSPAANQLSPAANQLHLKLFGTYENRKELDDGKNFSPEDFSPEDASKLPTCYKAKVYEYYQKKYQKEYIQPKKVNYSKALETRNSWGNDTEFLKEIAPNIYGKDFIDEGPFENRFKNGSLAVEIALKNLFQKIADRNLSQLGFSLFLFSISAITSLIACLLAISLSYRSEFKDSHSDAAELEIDNWLEEQWDQLINKHRQEEQQLLQKNVLEENN